MGRDLFVRPDVQVPGEVLGSTYGGYCVFAGPLGPDSVIYSFGIGHDLSFDLAVVARFGSVVHAFDPTPDSIRWIAEQRLPERVVFHPVGVADRDGQARFRPPDNPAHVSHAMIGEGMAQHETVEFPVRTLPGLMKDLGHARLDLLKMDIEGAEYAVLDALCRDRLSVDQIVVEFHHGHPGFNARRTRAALDTLRAAGYLLFHVSSRGEEYSFLHERLSALAAAPPGARSSR